MTITDQVIRDRKTKEKLASLDRHETVAWIHELEDRATELESAIDRVIEWRGLDGDGITDPLREELYDLVRS